MGYIKNEDIREYFWLGDFPFKEVMQPHRDVCITLWLYIPDASSKYTGLSDLYNRVEHSLKYLYDFLVLEGSNSTWKDPWSECFDISNMILSNTKISQHFTFKG